MIRANKKLIFKTVEEAQNNIHRIHHIDKEGFTSLFFCEDLDVVSFLIKNGLNVNHQSKKGVSPLMLSVSCPYDDIQKEQLLLDNGADVNLLDKNNENALFYANGLGYAQMLVEHGINIHQRSKYGHNILAHMLHLEAYEIYEYLLRLGVDPDNKDCDGENILFQGGLGLNSIKEVISYGADVLHINNHGQNVLRAAFSPEIMEYFIEQGVDPLVIDDDGHNLYFQKANHYNNDIFDVISKYDIDINKVNNKQENLIQYLLSDIDDYKDIMDRLKPYYEEKINKFVSLGFIMDSKTEKLIQEKIYNA